MKVNKRIGKLKQWTGEKLGGQQKTELSEDFQSLEQDVELRKAGVERMYSVSKEFSKHLTRKVEPEGTDTGKVLPIDALGLVFANHGDEFGHESSFGQALMSFGRAQQQIATATANFSDHLNSGWLSSLEKSIAQMAEYTNQRKKLDSRRLTYDAMLAKVQKSKKEKRELEDDLRVAKNRYEETSEEVQERAVGIQDAEADQMLALTRLLEIESNWIEEQKRIMDDLKKNWPDPSVLKNTMGGRKKITAHTFGAEAASVSKPLIRSKSGSIRHQSRLQPEEEEEEEEEEQQEEEDGHGSHQVDEYEYEEREQDLSPRRQPRPAVTAPVQPRLPSSRPGSMSKDKGSSISNSNSRYGGVRIPGMPPVHGGSVHSEEPNSPTEQQHRSRINNTLKRESSSPNLRRPIAKPTKWMRAKWAYNAAESDELELNVGDRIKITSEINSEWFVGRNEATGRSGMFPAAYCCTLEDSEPKYLIPDSSDTFADPDDHYVDEGEGVESYEQDESEAAGLKLNASISSAHRPVTTSLHPQRAGSYPGKPIPASNGPSAMGKRPPPPPPSRRLTSARPIPPPPASSHDHDEDQPEAFGSVSELKKRLGMFK